MQRGHRRNLPALKMLATNFAQDYIIIHNSILLCYTILSIVASPFLTPAEGSGDETITLLCILIAECATENSLLLKTHKVSQHPYACIDWVSNKAPSWSHFMWPLYVYTWWWTDCCFYFWCNTFIVTTPCLSQLPSVVDRGPSDVKLTTSTSADKKEVSLSVVYVCSYPEDGGKESLDCFLGTAPTNQLSMCMYSIVCQEYLWRWPLCIL